MKSGIESFILEEAQGLLNKQEPGKCPGHWLGAGGYGQATCDFPPTVTLEKHGNTVGFCKLHAEIMMKPVNGWVSTTPPTNPTTVST